MRKLSGEKWKWSESEVSQVHLLQVRNKMEQGMSELNQIISAVQSLYRKKTFTKSDSSCWSRVKMWECTSDTIFSSVKLIKGEGLKSSEKHISFLNLKHKIYLCKHTVNFISQYYHWKMWFHNHLFSSKYIGCTPLPSIWH